MDRIVLRFAGEWYIQDGFTELRDHLGKPLPQELKFIKTTIEEIKALEEPARQVRLSSGCTLEVAGFTALRLDPATFGERVDFYTINTPEER